jgi:hypothetical protein
MRSDVVVKVYSYNLYYLKRKLLSAAAGLEPFFEKILRQKLQKENALDIAEYINTAKREINISTGYRRINIQTLVDLSKFHLNKKNFKEMIKEDILQYLDSLRRPEASDPLHKWIGSYNLKRIITMRFGNVLHTSRRQLITLWTKRQNVCISSQYGGISSSI